MQAWFVVVSHNDIIYQSGKSQQGSLLIVSTAGERSDAGVSTAKRFNLLRQNAYFRKMDIAEGIALIEGAVNQELTSSWAEVGAGTGFFCQLLDGLLPTPSKIYAVDKSPHALYTLQHEWQNEFHIIEGDFDKKIELPICDGILLANTLHYSPHPEKTLENLFQYLKVGGKIVFVEYELETPKPPWIPYPLPFLRLKEIMLDFGFSGLQEMGRVGSNYGHDYIYSAVAERM